MHTELPDSAPAGRADGLRWQWWLALVSPLLALIVVRPWQTGAFPVWDFAEMLPILRGADGAVDAFARLSAFTRSDGRANYLTYAQVVGTWLVAGGDAGGWQWQRALFMLVLGGLFTVVVRRLGGTPFAAAVGALLLLLAVPGTEGWLFLSGEPLAAILLLCVVLLGTSPPTASRTALLLLAVLGTMLAKEVVGVALPSTLFLALLWDASRGATMRWSVPWLALLTVGLLVVLALESFSVLNAVREAKAGAYANQFEPGLDRLGRLPQLMLAILLPVQYVQSGASGLLYPANIAYLLLIGVGGWVWWRQSAPTERRGGAVLVLVLLSVPAIGALTYTFWPRYSAFYAIPFTLGSAGLLTAALSTMQGAGAPIRRISWSVAAVLLIFASFASARTIGDRRAFANLALVTVRQLGQLPTVDSVLVVKAGPGRNRWPVTGPELERYAQAMGEADTHIPVIRDASCEVVAGRLQVPLMRMAILNDQNACGPLPSASHRFRASADFFDWLALHVRHDTLVIELLATPPTIP